MICALARRCARPSRSLALSLLFPAVPAAFGQTAPPADPAPDSAVTRRDVPQAPSPASELIFEGFASYGHYKIFASGSGSFVYATGVEYDRHSWGKMAGARTDYAGELLLVFLKEGDNPDIWGTPQNEGHYHIVPGLGIYPIGVRWIWFDGRRVMPYVSAKGGIVGFTEKAMSAKGTYENFSLHSSLGVKVRLTGPWDLRVDLFSDYHFSDAFIVPVNPGLDVMNANIGLVYHLGGRNAAR
ncbi:MAG TPA: acyloxyacyl hydrolase [Terracidiphilus sp.]|nr:acyloxyacyl hydrolase [Terracidiphilus sp.]